MKIKYLSLLILTLTLACASKKDIHYFQDIKENTERPINYQSATIQPNDILRITVESNVPEAAIPYNRGSGQQVPQQGLQLFQLDGYLVSFDNTINFPVLGEISTKDKTTQELAKSIKTTLEVEGHLNDANVIVRLVNAKFTILGEVNQPGTFSFTEQNITILQALGYAGDLTINGKRDDIIITREVDGVRKVSHINLTQSDFMDSEYYFIKPNDLIVVNQNDPRVKQAGFISNIGTILPIVSLALSITILLTR